MNKLISLLYFLNQVKYLFTRLVVYRLAIYRRYNYDSKNALFIISSLSDRIKPNGYIAISALKRCLALENRYLIIWDFSKVPRWLGPRGTYFL